jgi:hypothetical protein
MEYFQATMNRFDSEALSGVITGAELVHRKLGHGDRVGYVACQAEKVNIYCGDYGFPVWSMVRSPRTPGTLRGAGKMTRRFA